MKATDTSSVGHGTDSAVETISRGLSYSPEIRAGLGDCGVQWSPDDTTLVGIGGCNTAYRIPLDNPEAAIRLTDAEGDLHFFAWQRVAP